MKHPRIEVRELTKSFDETVILDQISFKVNLGESLVIIGASGSGKSVLTKCIVGLLKPDNGDVFLDGHRMGTSSSDSTPLAANSISYVFQNSALFDSLTVIENISFGPQFLNKQNEKDANEIAREVMIKLGIQPKFWPMYPKELSSSSRKIVAIARALAVKPKIIILLGSTAMEAFFGSNLKISKERGIWKEMLIKDKTFLTMVTFHPAYLLRQNDQKKYSWIDLKNIRNKIDELKIGI